MKFKTPDTSYWDRKFIAYMHDPIDKILKIQGHEQRTEDFIQIFGLQKPDDKFWQLADGIASGFERGQVPTYNPEPHQNGAVDFVNSPLLTHPTGTNKHLQIKFSDMPAQDQFQRQVEQEVLEFLKKEIGIHPCSEGYSDEPIFKNNPEKFALARFLYTHLVLRFHLAEKNIGNLGALWHRMPADSRFPDHSIWHHNAMCSALNSCIESGGGPDQIGLMVFSITPVQPFIARARKLRDFWTGSVILSWMAFEGLCWVMENLGPDHVLYPSLIDQPLINIYLETKWNIKGHHKPAFWQAQPSDIASLPNKFLFLLPLNYTEEIGDSIKQHIINKWYELSELVFKKLQNELNWKNNSLKNIQTIFHRQISHFWEMQWACTKLLSYNDREEIDLLLPASDFSKQFEFLECSHAIIEQKHYKYQTTGMGALYSVTHKLVQSALAVRKNIKTNFHSEENGQKCHLCGEFEVLHDFEHKEGLKAATYKKHIDRFWQAIREKFGDSDFRENEKLCSLCLIKRLLPYAVPDDHILCRTFKKADTFPSTTEIALHHYFEKEKIPVTERKKKAQEIYNSKSGRGQNNLKNQDKYYALLLMDGDKMGYLVSGETIAATWESVMHPDLQKRLTEPDFDSVFRKNWKLIFEKIKKRFLTPAIHAAISESLGDFALYGVSSIITAHQGRLIYAGGDDVCAVLPVSEALEAAREIANYYTGYFKLITRENNSYQIEELTNTWQPVPGKLSVNLGQGQDISISAGILICHHKENLSQMIARAHTLLEQKAKEQGGRNSCAIELKKRAGGSRYFIRKWSDHKAWQGFASLGQALARSGDAHELASSLVYRLERMRPGIEAILKNQNHHELLLKFIHMQLEKSGLQASEQIARSLAAVIVSTSQNQKQFDAHGPIIAGFMASCRR